MSTEFAFNTFGFGDQAGNGEWLIGHFRQHLRYNDALAGLTPAIIIPVFPIMTVQAGKLGKREWLDSHEKWHEQIRPFANVTGIDLSLVDLDDQGQFYDWLNLHNQEHGIFDQIFGVG